MGMLGVLMALLAGYMLWQMSELNNITSVLAHRNVPVSELAGEINTDTAEYRIMEFRYLIENDMQKSSALKDRLDEVRKKFEREVRQIGDLCISGNAKQCVIDIERDLKKYLDYVNGIVVNPFGFALRLDGEKLDRIEKENMKLKVVK